MKRFLLLLLPLLTHQLLAAPAFPARSALRDEFRKLYGADVEAFFAGKKDRCISTIYKNDKFWHSHGGCLLNSNDAEQKKKAFSKLKTFFLNIDSYKEFKHLLDFRGIDGEGAAKFGKVESSPFLAFVAIRAYLVFKYVIDNHFRERTTDNVTDFILAFEKKNPPEGFEIPRKFVDERDLEYVDGSWYVDTEGFIVYRAKADFGSFDFDIAKPLIQKKALEILKDTMERLYEEVTA